MSKLHASGHRLHALLERVRVLLEPVTKRWLGSPMDDQQAREAGLQPFEAEADALISRQGTHRAQKIGRASCRERV